MIVRKLYRYDELFPINGGKVLEATLHFPVVLRIHRDFEDRVEEGLDVVERVVSSNPPMLRITLYVRVPEHLERGTMHQDVLMAGVMREGSAFPLLNRLDIADDCIWEVRETDFMNEGHEWGGQAPYIPPEPGFEFIVEQTENPGWKLLPREPTEEDERWETDNFLTPDERLYGLHYDDDE